METADGFRRDVSEEEALAPQAVMAKSTKPAKAKKVSGSAKPWKWVRRIGIALLVLVAIYTIPSVKLALDAKKAADLGQAFKTALAAKNLDAIKANTTKLRTSVKRIQGDLVFFQPLRIIPFLGSYVSDGVHFSNAAQHGLIAVDIITESLTPYADLLGLKGNGMARAGTAEEQLQFAVTTLEKVTPKFDDIAREFSAIKAEIDHVNPKRYPKFVFGQRIGNTIALTVSTIDQVGGLLVEARPLIEVLPTVAGAKEPKTYLVLFQNDKELRPSGGFLTAYTYITINKGKITASDSNDIYYLDQSIERVCRRRVCLELKPPRLIVKYLPEATGKAKTVLSARDSNIYPDFVASAMQFKTLYDIAGFKKVDGIIAVDTHVIQDILDVTGPVKVAGYQQQFTKDNVLGLLMAYTDYVQAGKNDRKALLGDLMGTVLRFVSDFGRDKMQPMINTTLTLLNQKHILIYLFDQKGQAAIEKLNWAGRMKEYDGDYLYINDANFASGKANLYVTEKVDQKVEVKDGVMVKTVKIHIEDPHGYDGFLNPFYRDALRVYVPKGSVLISGTGSANGKIDSYEEFNKTVFEAFVFMYPKNKVDLTLVYRLPFSYKKGDEYKLLLQKQPGITGWPYTMDILGHSVEPITLKQDQEVKVKI